MRFDVPVEFYSDASRYDPIAGEKVGVPSLITTIMANVTDVGTDRAQQILGSYVNNAKVVRMPTGPPGLWAYLVIDGVKYRLETSRQPLKGHTLIVGRDDSAKK